MQYYCICEPKTPMIGEKTGFLFDANDLVTKPDFKSIDTGCTAYKNR